MAVYGGRPARVSSTATFDWMMRAEGLRVSAIRSQGGNAGRGYSLVSWGMEVRGRPIGGDECA